MKTIDTTSTRGKLRKISRRTLVKVGFGSLLGSLAAPFVLRLLPAHAQSSVIKIGFVSPRTGPLAGFGEADPFILDQVRGVLAKGLVNGDKTFPVQIIPKDSQSSASRASEVAAELILGDKVDLIVAAATPDTTNPVADQAEVNEVPCITTNCPWQPYFFGRKGDPKTGFKWTYHFFWGLEDVIGAFLALWDSAPTNKVVGGLFPNDADGNAWGDSKLGLPPALANAGYKLLDPGRYQVMNNDFTSQISAFKAAGAEIVTGNMIPPDFATFWSQAAQQGFKPKIVTIGHRLAGAARQRSHQRDLVDTESSVQIGPHWSERRTTHRSLHQNQRAALDSADRVPARVVRGCDRRAQAGQKSTGFKGDPRSDRNNRLSLDRWSG
jgi:branched-chain amino acid transport system substrate-binding protein